MPGRLDSKVAVITGGASGIGRACAERFADEGADILVADLDEARGAETVAAVKARGRKAAFIRTDTSSERDCEAMADAAIARFGRIDALVAAAGISHALYVSGSDPGEVRGDRTAASVLNKPVEY
jgi:NAD(P)-dependent dehydrogenase (short-subunit alcohol dehydrogenase family)